MLRTNSPGASTGASARAPSPLSPAFPHKNPISTPPPTLPSTPPPRPPTRPSILPRLPRPPRPSLASVRADSRSNHADEPVNVPLGVIQIGRNANVPFAQADHNIFLPQTLIIFLRFLGAACGKASISAALRRIQGTRDHKAILGQSLEQEFN